MRMEPVQAQIEARSQFRDNSGNAREPGMGAVGESVTLVTDFHNPSVVTAKVVIWQAHEGHLRRSLTRIYFWQEGWRQGSRVLQSDDDGWEVELPPGLYVTVETELELFGNPQAVPDIPHGEYSFDLVGAGYPQISFRQQAGGAGVAQITQPARPAPRPAPAVGGSGSGQTTTAGAQAGGRLPGWQSQAGSGAQTGQSQGAQASGAGQPTRGTPTGGQPLVAPPVPPTP